MPQPPTFTTWKITCRSSEEAQALQQWLSSRIDLERVLTDTVRATRKRVEQVQTVPRRLGDYFAAIRLLPDSQANPTSFRLVFHRRSDAGRFWKDLMVNVLQEIDKTPQKASIELESKGELEPITPTRIHFWTHPSVLRLPRSEDPVSYITQRAREVVFNAVEGGWTGPPFDPFELASYMNLSVVPQDDILDARTVPLEGDRVQIEFNPNRPKGRLRFSIAHELAHTLFPDCHERVRNRAAREHMQEQDWQLELLCNVAAAELLMPIGSFPDLKQKAISIDTLMELRRQYDVSTEALLLRAVRLTEIPSTVFCASRQQGETSDRYRIDYTVGSKSWADRLTSGTLLPESTVIRECTGIGFTAKGDEQWPGIADHLHVEAIGIPPYPKHRYPRVAGIAHVLEEHAAKRPNICYLRGDATQPRGQGMRIICHVVNDKAVRWGGGFALVIRRRFPQAQDDFVSWAQAHREQFALGNSRLCSIDDSLDVCSMICQHGYGPSRTPRIRYGAMKACLEHLADKATKKNATVHMPRIGCGQAGGSWSIVSELIDGILCTHGIPVTVYDLPNMEAAPAPHPRDLFSSSEP